VTRRLAIITLASCGPTAPAVEPAPAVGSRVRDPAPPAAEQGASPGPDRAAAPALLDLHNQFRADHCAPALTWSTQLAAVAQRWADRLRDNGCAFEHSRTMLGENLAAGTTRALDDRTIVEMWYREVDQYDWRRAGFDMATGHFTQLVWVGTARVGCGRSTCDGTDIVVCNYDPPGNVETQYRDNVLPTSCKRSR
jgi:uncharacterized protein YkwD